MGRTIVIGDIHGCYDELNDLLERCGASAGDRVVSVGDILRKGPHPDRCVALWRERGYLAVQGNQDVRVLEAPFWKRWFSESLSRDLLDVIAGWPLFLDLADIGVVVVHAGVLPNSDRFSPQLVPREVALTLRYVRRDGDGMWRPVGKGEERDGDRFWSEVWRGDRLVTYGHTPRPQPRIDAAALGLDTGCVYGGALTAAIFTAPRTYALCRVPARKRHAS